MAENEDKNDPEKSTYSIQQIKEMERASLYQNIGRSWYKFSRNPLSVIGIATVVMVIMLAIFAPYVAPYPKHAGPFTDFAHAKIMPSLAYPFGTDQIGRDILSRIIFGLRSSLLMGVVVLALVVPPGVFLGLLAGYYKGSWIDTVIMRITDIFLAVPPLILALAVASVLEPNLWHGMLAVSLRPAKPPAGKAARPSRGRTLPRPGAFSAAPRSSADIPDG